MLQKLFPSSLWLAVALAIAPVFSLPVYAQTSSSETGSVLDQLRYDAKQQGPLILVGRSGISIQRPSSASTGATLRQFSDATDCRALPIGALTAIVPKTMVVIETNPGKPDPFADMSVEDRLQVLFSLWTPEQWAKAGSDTGIGSGDLTDAQRPLFESAFPAETVPVKTSQLRRSPEGFDVWNPINTTEAIPSRAMRLRISLRTTFSFYVVGKPITVGNNFGNDSGWFRTEPDGTRTWQQLELPNQRNRLDEPQDSAFGVKLFQTVPNRAKQSELDLDAPALSVPIRLDSSITTVGALMKAVAKVTRLEIVADKQYAALPVAIRTIRSGQTVPVSDLLKAITRSVCGTFRRLDGNDNSVLYLLTDDVVGYGTRIARLNTWADKPNRLSEKALTDARKPSNESIEQGAIHFREDDPMALPESLQTKLLDTLGRAEVKFTELTPSLQKATTKAATEWQRPGSSPISPSLTVQTDKVLLGTDTRYEWIVPDGRAFGMVFSGRSSLFPGGLAVRANTPAPAVPVARMPVELQRRIAILSIPEDKEETESLLALAKQKGFREVWFRIPFADAVRQTRETIALGKKAGVRIGIVVGWLRKREANPNAPSEMDIQGDNGDNWSKRYLSDGLRKPESRLLASYGLIPRYTNWVIPQTDHALEVAGETATVPGLYALILENTTPPGYAGWGQYHAGRTEYPHFGYHSAMRLDCVRAKGFDPVDVEERISDGAIGKPKIMINESNRQRELALFRQKQNDEYLRDVFKTLKSVSPRAPLYISDRAIDGSAYPFYVRWEKSDLLPTSQSDEHEEPRARAEALRCSPESLLVITGSSDRLPLAYFAPTWNERVIKALKWRGLVYRIEPGGRDSAHKALEILPDAPPSNKREQ